MELKITDGPNKFSLMTSLFASTSHDNHKVIFTCVNKETGERFKIDSIVQMVGRESGSGESWVIGLESNGACLKGYYSSQSRKGHLKQVPYLY